MKKKLAAALGILMLCAPGLFACGGKPDDGIGTGGAAQLAAIDTGYSLSAGTVSSLGAAFDAVNPDNLDKVFDAPQTGFTVDEGASPSAAFTPADLIASGMVIQRNAAARLWGATAYEGEFAVEINGLTSYGRAADGAFEIFLQPMPAGGPYNLDFYWTGGRLQLANVYVGEVFLLSGQSNMDWLISYNIDSGDQHLHGGTGVYQGGAYVPSPVYDRGTNAQWLADSPERDQMIKDYYEEATEQRTYNNPYLRIFHVGIHDLGDLAFYENATSPASSVNGHWSGMSGNDMLNFSAFGFFFGKELQRLTGIPVGLVLSALGGTYLTTWSPPATYAARGSDYAYGNDYVKGGNAGSGAHNLASRMYNLYIDPIKKFSYKSVVWVQGEGQNIKYGLSLKDTVEGWRAEFGQPSLGWTVLGHPTQGATDSFPADYVKKGPEEPTASYIAADTREQQKWVAEQLPGVCVSVNHEFGDYDEVHQYDKKGTGYRAAYKFMEFFYQSVGRLTPPEAVSAVKAENGDVLVTFRNVGSGLKVIHNGRNIEAAGRLGIFYPAEAVAEGNDTLRISSDYVFDIKQVRYGYRNYPKLDRNNVVLYYSIFSGDNFGAGQFLLDAE
ncbi:MAG: sialate O-acetylesterase [Clostridiales bacterium]|jgi:hypothetical protein|nr:sialate O-acetylesterase [Clostridiales bacterium]